MNGIWSKLWNQKIWDKVGRLWSSTGRQKKLKGKKKKIITLPFCYELIIDQALEMILVYEEYSMSFHSLNQYIPCILLFSFTHRKWFCYCIIVFVCNFSCLLCVWQTSNTFGKYDMIFLNSSLMFWHFFYFVWQKAKSCLQRVTVDHCAIII